MPRRTPARFASRAAALNIPSAANPDRSSYFNSSSSARPCPTHFEPLRNTPDDSLNVSSQYDASTSGYTGSSSLLSTVISRPTTASGRKSRASTLYLGPNDGQNIICAVSEARGVSPSVGVAFVNTSLGEVTLSQICDTQTYIKTVHKMQVMEPSKIIFMSTACPPVMASTLFTVVEENVPDVQLEAFDRSAWSEKAGWEYIEKLAFEDDVEPLKVATEGKYYATASFCAVSLFPSVM